MPGRIKNIEAVKRSLRTAGARKLAGLTMGMKKAMLYIQAESMKVVPVDYGPLRASVFTRSENDNTPNVRVVTGYTAAYAVYVHENAEALHGEPFNIHYAKELAAGHTTGPFRHTRGPNQTYKFLERPWRQAHNSGVLLAIIANEIP